MPTRKAKDSGLFINWPSMGVVMALSAVLFSASCNNATGVATIVTVVKVAGIPWFDRMAVGVKQFSVDTGVKTVQVGPGKGDAQLQVQLIQDMLAKSPKAIAVVPLSPEALEPVLAKAQARGIKVVTHEASDIRNVDYDIEAFRNADYGVHLMDHLAKCMNHEGQYAVFVASLTSKTHNEWVDAAIARQKAKYPRMQLVGSKNESYDDQQKAYNKALELLRAYPNLKGFEGSSSLDAPGIGQAVEQRGLADKVCVVGTALPSQTKKYLNSGAIDMISFWDPAAAGYAMNQVAQRLIENKSVAEGDDLGIDGYRNIRIRGKVIYGQAWIDVDKMNSKQYEY